MVYTNFPPIVTLQPIIGSATPFRGFLLQPRLVADDTTVVGLFAAPANGDAYRLSSCTPPEVCIQNT